ncbi:hypothetical protein [Senegalia massiliensis]|uniref:Replication protein n=1 Tax=Senegalia massiliensis TaxID=1720316 RepID=A0A845QY33_9CLOT|nr:hypothetical protein [Senegalia massiliensis]NBI07070.1 hypothetical protein [Senegalia massiliensis]
MSKLFGRKPLVLDEDLAKIIGLNESIVIQQIHYWIEINKSKNINFYEDKYWTYNTMIQWQEEFPFWSIETVKRTLKKVRDKNLLLIGNFNKLKIGRTLWYTINYSELEKIMENSKKTQPIPEISTEINKNINNKSISQSNNIVNSNKEERQTKNRFNYNDFSLKYKRILDNSYIDYIDEPYREPVKHAIRLLILDGINKYSR